MVCGISMEYLYELSWNFQDIKNMIEFMFRIEDFPAGAIKLIGVSLIIEMLAMTYV